VKAQAGCTGNAFTGTRGIEQRLRALSPAIYKDSPIETGSGVCEVLWCSSAMASRAVVRTLRLRSWRCHKGHNRMIQIERVIFPLNAESSLVAVERLFN